MYNHIRMADTQQKDISRSLAPALIAAAAGAAAAGYYFYGSKNAAKNRQRAAKWAGELKGEVMQGVRQLQKVDKRQVVALIDAAAGSYEKVRSIRRDDIQRAAAELRENWQRLVSESRVGKGKSAPRGKKRARTTAKTTVTTKRTRTK